MINNSLRLCFWISGLELSEHLCLKTGTFWQPNCTLYLHIILYRRQFSVLPPSGSWLRTGTRVRSWTPYRVPSLFPGTTGFCSNHSLTSKRSQPASHLSLWGRLFAFPPFLQSKRFLPGLRITENICLLSYCHFSSIINQ